MKNIIVSCIIAYTLLTTGCASWKKHLVEPPSVSTIALRDNLEKTKSNLEQAGLSNTKVAENIDNALSLTEQIQKLLNDIDNIQSQLDSKTVK